MNNEAMVTFTKKEGGRKVSINPKGVTSVEEGAHGVSITTAAGETFYVTETHDEVVTKLSPPRKKYMRPRPS